MTDYKETAKWLLRLIEDRLLGILQRRCEHPDEMIAADILEGCGGNIQVKFCRRCGSIKTDWSSKDSREHCWRRPDPNLWR